MATIQDARIKTLLQHHPFSLIPIGVHTVDNSINTATTVELPSGANALLVQATEQNARYTIDGTTPTASTGFVLKAGNDPVIILAPTEDVVFNFISETAGSVINYQAVRVGGC